MPFFLEPVPTIHQEWYFLCLLLEEQISKIKGKAPSAAAKVAPSRAVTITPVAKGVSSRAVTTAKSRAVTTTKGATPRPQPRTTSYTTAGVKSTFSVSPVPTSTEKSSNVGIYIGIAIAGVVVGIILSFAGYFLYQKYLDSKYIPTPGTVDMTHVNIG
ncbi:9043_t:CDS:2 [Cetraspora pellucida]|uniref:9043_t:CDS:1 n=1 Tax=Cetraspora pellucida TaxID=1433469 RepID=A0A9N9CL75_9GLOM|nr:9043_t:CDS:2 [Cetraspora pellucida]